MTKYNYSELAGNSDPLTGLISLVSSATYSLLGFTLLLLIFIVLSYVYMRRTQDIGKSLTSAGFAASLSGLLLYYLGIFVGLSLISDLVMYGAWVGVVLSIAGLWFFRMNQD